MADMKPWGERYLMGTSVTRLDGEDKVTGRAKYTYDLNLPGMLYGKILRSPHPHARVLQVDLARAAAHPGVKAVFDFNKKTVRYAGDEVAAVAAESPELAEEALKLIDVTYEPLPFSVREETSMAEGAAQIHPSGNVNVPERAQREKGDIAAGFAEADAVIERTFRVPVQTHTSLETHGAVAQWEGDKLTVWCSTQGVVSVRDELAEHFKLPKESVRVLCQYMGGGFGSKFGAGAEGLAASILARTAKVPVKLMLNRKEEQLAVGNRPSAIMTIKMGAKKDGKITAFQSQTYGTGGVGGIGNIPLPYVVDIANYKSELKDVHINAGGSRAMRAPGHPQAEIAMDCAMDALADAIGMDPLAFRKANGSSQNETRLQQYEIGARAIGWDRRNKVAGSPRGPVKRGIGMGCGMWGGGGNKSSYVQVQIHSDGSVDAKCAIQDIGTGSRTLLAMTVAEELGLRLNQVTAHVGDTLFPPGTGSGGSNTTPSMVPAAKTAARKAKGDLLALVAPLLGVDASTLETHQGKIQVAGGGKSMTWSEATAQMAGDIVVTANRDEGYHSSGAAGVHFAEVEVDVETGRIQPIKIVAVNDCGLVVNKLLAESQVNGGVIGGLSYALLENRLLDRRTGLMVNPNMEAYKVAGAMEMPEIVAILMDMPERGVIGLGEPATIPTAGALANAVYNAIGVWVTDFPMTPDKVLNALAQT
ncbi:MAG: xanthine dehydrogenase family protein molybdopterin-binding subunit [bacterium]|nr:xanthine dehydrogenase family protein molybdopterin-binding subunit [bacterium]